MDLLEKGLSFVPTLDIYKQQMNKLKKDVSDYHRRLKLASHFGPGDGKEIPPFQPRTNWEPAEEGLPQSLKQVIQEDTNTVVSLPGHIKEKDNLTKEQVRALWALAKNEDKVIKSADKGSAIVIMDRHQYLIEGERQLSNSNHYRQLEQPIYKQMI